MRAVASRRGFLRGIATVSAVAGTVAAPYALRAAPAEDAELIRLGGELDRAGAAYLAARAAKATCVEHFERIKPEIPVDILKDYGDRLFHLGEWPPNYDGSPDAKLAGPNYRIRLYDRRELLERSKGVDGRTRVGRRVRLLERKTEAFHTAHKAARIEADVPVAADRCFYAGKAVLNVGFKIAAITATTMSGLSVKGRAGLAMHRVWKDEHGRQIEDSYNRLLRNLATVQGGENPLCA